MFNTNDLIRKIIPQLLDGKPQDLAGTLHQTKELAEIVRGPISDEDLPDVMILLISKFALDRLSAIEGGLRAIVDRLTPPPPPYIPPHMPPKK